MDAAWDDEPEGKAAGNVYQAWCIDIDIHLYTYRWIESTGYDVLHMLHLINIQSILIDHIDVLNMNIVLGMMGSCNVNLYFGMRL